MAHLKDDEWPAEDELTTTEKQQRALGCHCDDVPPNPPATQGRPASADVAAEPNEPKLTNTKSVEAVD